LFAREAVERGAPAVVSELPKPEDFTGVWIEVEHGREAMALASRNFFGAPDERIVLTGITGTNGKTTTSYLLDAVLRAAGKNDRIPSRRRGAPGGQHHTRFAGHRPHSQRA
jgi:UDP-N-acetylmuramoyl-L-alanyl-D-glutamate--2,6-diaminopimelate ligase